MYFKSAFTLLVFTAAPAFAQNEAATAESQAVLGTIDRMFGALTAKDPAALVAVTIPDGRATAATVDAEGKDQLHFRTWAEFAQRLPAIPGVPVEKLTGSQVQVDGPIAMVWAPYTFTLDGKLLHCGINHFDLVKQDGAWRILNVTWTQRKTGCRQ